MIPGSWQTVSIVALLAFLAVGGVIVRPRKRGASRRKRAVLPDPWSGAVVRQPKYFTPHWNATVGRAYRSMAAERKTS